MNFPRSNPLSRESFFLPPTQKWIGPLSFREPSGPTYLTRKNYRGITVTGPAAAFACPVAAAVPALAVTQEQA
jgi:hypothetical protein